MRRSRLRKEFPRPQFSNAAGSRCGADGSSRALQAIEKQAPFCGIAAKCPPKCPHVTSALVSLQQISMDFTEISRERLGSSGPNFTTTAAAHSTPTRGYQPDTRLEPQPIDTQQTYAGR
jgi:hypothetical protein